MHTDCASIDPFVTSYVDGELALAERDIVDRHLRACGSCRARIAVEQSVRGLVHAKRSGVGAERASDLLRERCAGLAGERVHADRMAEAHGARVWRARLIPVALAASLIVVLSGAVLYEVTDRSTTVLAAELAADHVKCFAINDLLETHDTRTAVETAMLSGFAWRMSLPPELNGAGLELVGARPCLYAEGKIAHIMYRYQGQPVSVFMLPRTARHEELVDV